MAVAFVLVLVAALLAYRWGVFVGKRFYSEWLYEVQDCNAELKKRLDFCQSKQGALMVLRPRGFRTHLPVRLPDGRIVMAPEEEINPFETPVAEDGRRFDLVIERRSQ